MIAPGKDKELIRAVLVNDAYISRAGFTEKYIVKTNANTEFLASGDANFRIFIALSTPDRSRSHLVKDMIYSVTVSGNREKSATVDNVVEQVIALLDSRALGGGNILYLDNPPMELSSHPAIYAVETTFLCQCTNLNVVKK